MAKNNKQMTKLKHTYNINNMKAGKIKFTSNKEADHYINLCKRKLDKEVKYFLRFVPFDLGKYGTYTCDFLVVWADDSVSFESVKSHTSDHSLTSKIMAEQLYDIKINQV